MDNPYKRDQDDFLLDLEQAGRQERINKAKAVARRLGLGVHVLLFESTYGTDGLEALEALERKIQRCKERRGI